MCSHSIFQSPEGKSNALLTKTSDRESLNVNDLSSSLQHFQWLDYLVFSSMLIVSTVIGIYFGFYNKNKKRVNNRESEGFAALEYLVGGRKMNVFPVSLSQIASLTSGIAILGISSEIYVYGVQYVFFIISAVIAVIITWYTYLPVLYELQLTSLYEYLELRFDRKVRIFGSFLFIISIALFLPVAIYASALAFNQVSSINKDVIIVVTSVVCIFYTFLGGIKAVVWIDVFQTFIILGSLIVIAIKGTMDVGGLSEVIYHNMKSGRIEFPEYTLDPTVRYSILSIIIGGSIHWIPFIAQNQAIIQRCFSLRSLKACRRALVILILGIWIVLLMSTYNGLLIYTKYHDCDPLSTELSKEEDQLLPLLVMETLGMFPGLPGLFIAGVFSATLSTLSSTLNSLSAVILEDFCKPYSQSPLSEKKTLFVMKSTVIIFGVICLGLVFVVEKLKMILQLSMSFGAMTNGALCGMFLTGMLIPWINTKSILFGSISAFGIMTWICIRAQYALAIGEIVFPRKPISTSGCTYSFTKIICVSNVTAINELSTSSIYNISFLLYVFLGVVLTIVFSGLSSFVFGRNDPISIDQKLLVPFLRKFITPVQYSGMRPEMHEQELIRSRAL